MIAGAPAASQGDATSVGAAYVFTHKHGSWTLQTKLMAEDLQPFSAFGFAVGIDGNAALIGAAFASNSSGVASGAAYAFERSANSWKQPAKLAARDGENF